MTKFGVLGDHVGYRGTGARAPIEEAKGEEYPEPEYPNYRFWTIEIRTVDELIALAAKYGSISILDPFDQWPTGENLPALIINAYLDY